MFKSLKHNSREKYENSNPQFLISVFSVSEADVYESLLDAYGIPTLIKYKGAGDALRIYLGTTNTEIEIYVPSELLEKAKELLAAENDFGEDNV